MLYLSAKNGIFYAKNVFFNITNITQWFKSLKYRKLKGDIEG